MAKKFARKFYKSKEWKQCRDAYFKSQYGLCEMCRAAGNEVPGEEVHHKTFLTPKNIDNPEVTLRWSNLQLLCKSCHNKIHQKAYAMHKKSEPVRAGVMFDENGELIKV